METQQPMNKLSIKYLPRYKLQLNSNVTIKLLFGFQHKVFIVFRVEINVDTTSFLHFVVNKLRMDVILSESETRLSTVHPDSRNYP